MLGSIGTKDGTILYHFTYGTFLGCHAISGVTSCGQPKCWLINIGLLAKFNFSRFVVHVHCVASVLSTTNCREVMNYSLINLFNFSSTNGQFVN